jgi:hypothetical protein
MRIWRPRAPDYRGAGFLVGSRPKHGDDGSGKCRSLLWGGAQASAVRTTEARLPGEAPPSQVAVNLSGRCTPRQGQCGSPAPASEIAEA